jgi:hypothetical protein
MSKQKKWSSAEAKRAAMELDKSWEKIQMDHAPKKPIVKRNLKRPSVMPSNPRVSELRNIKSLDTGITGAVNCGTETKIYTGDKIIGIATMHKSNLVPIFSDTEAKAVATMRR